MTTLGGLPQRRDNRFVLDDPRKSYCRKLTGERGPAKDERLGPINGRSFLHTGTFSPDGPACLRPPSP